MKKCISVLLATIMMISSGLVVSANTNGSMENFKSSKTYTIGQFVDVSNSDWYAENVKMAYELSLVNGTSDTTFSPNSNLTIAEAITLASRMHNVYYGNTYSFVSSDVWYQTYVDYAIKNGIIKNNAYSNFDAFATRYQFAEIFSSALPDDALQVINQVADNSIPDVPMQSSYSNAVYKLYRAGILTGNDANGTFAPNTNIQRSAVAAIVSRMANVGLRQRITLNVVNNGNSLTSEDIYSKHSPAVFYIELYNNAGTPISSGSGFFIESNGVAITNYHVIEGANSAKITLPESKKTYDVAGVYTYNKEQDWAIIQVKGDGFLTLDIGSDDSVHTGQKVYAIGSPLGLQNTISEGLLSNKKVELGNVEYYQISAPISHGSSGGALLNENAQVIGITSASFVEGQNLNLAIPMRYIPLDFDHSNCKTLGAVMDENNFILPPTNIRIVKQDSNGVYIQWDAVEGADYYYFYYQEAGEESFWYDDDENTGEQIRMTRDNEYSTTFYGLENGKKYNIIVTSVKNGVESQDSDVFSFEFNVGSSIDMLRETIKSNATSSNGYLYKIGTDRVYEQGMSHYTALVYDSKSDVIYIEAVADFDSGNSVANLIYLDGAPERVNTQKRVMYLFMEPNGRNTVGSADINPSTFRESSNVVFHYYDSPLGNTVKSEDQQLSTQFTKIGLREANQVFKLYGLPFDMTDLGFVYFGSY